MVETLRSGARQELADRMSGDWPQQRKHPRVDLLATVEVHGDGGMMILTVRNLSVGGLFVCSDGQDLSGFAVGSRHEPVIFTPTDPERELLVRGRVVRHEADGMALEWRADDTASLKLSEMVAQASEGK